MNRWLATSTILVVVLGLTEVEGAEERWALQPLRRPAVPEVQTSATGRRVPRAEAGAALEAHEARTSVGRTVVEIG